MKKIELLVVFLCLSIAFAGLIQGETSSDEDLAQQVEELQKQVTQLEKRIETLEKTIQWLAQRSVEIPETFPKLHKMPEGWKEYEFNGVKYYIIPVKSAEKTPDRKKK